MIALDERSAWSLRGLFSGVRPEPSSVVELDEHMRQVHARGDVWMRRFLLGHLTLALLLAPVQDTWGVTLLTAPALTALFLSAMWRFPGAFGTRVLAGICLQGFVVLHVWQLHGVSEAQYLFFTAFTMMIVYQDWRALWPAMAGVSVLQVTQVFALRHDPANLFFNAEGFRTGYAALHYGVAVGHVVLCSAWAYLLKQSTLAHHRQHRLVVRQRERLSEHLDRTLRSESELQARTRELQADIEARRIAETDLRRMRDDLEETNGQLQDAIARANQLAVSAEAANHAKSAFLAVMSHEIRTPLNGVLGMAAHLLDTPLDDDQRSCLDTIRSSGQSLLVILNDVLDFSKIESGRFQIERLPFLLPRCIEEVSGLFSAQADKKGLSFVTRLEPGVPVAIMGDVTRLRQVLSNLVSNALKFTAAGEVAMEVWAEPPPAPGQVELHFTVSDSGIGIPEDKQAILFLPFSQLDVSTSRKYGGTGLGLAISKRLIEMMGGRMWCESIAGQGATFHFTLKTELTEMPAAETAPILAVTPQPGARVTAPRRALLVEDNMVNQRVALLMLKKLNLTADVATNGLEALAAVHAQDYDVVFMDWHMPEMNGLEATERIRKELPPERQPWIIGLTANAMNGDSKRCLEAGMNDYVPKPIRKEDLAAALSRIGQAVVPV